MMMIFYVEERNEDMIRSNNDRRNSIFFPRVDQSTFYVRSILECHENSLVTKPNFFLNFLAIHKMVPPKKVERFISREFGEVRLYF